MHNKAKKCTDKHAQCLCLTTNNITNWLDCSGDQKGFLQLWTVLFFPHLHQKEINSWNFWVHVQYQFFLPLHPPPHRQFGSCTLCHKSKTQLKGERHKEMTPVRKLLMLGRALAGRKSMGGNTSIHGNGTVGGRGGTKDIFFFFTEKWCICFTQGEKKQRRGERKKNTLLNIFWKKASTLVRLSCVVKVCFIQLCGSVCSCLSGLFLVEAQKDYSWHVQGHSVDTDALQEAELWIQHE